MAKIQFIHAHYRIHELVTNMHIDTKRAPLTWFSNAQKEKKVDSSSCPNLDSSSTLPT